MGLLQLIAKLFGKSALSKTIGTRTNVIRLPSNKLKKYTTRELDIEAVSEETAKAAKKEMEELIPEIPKMNDKEKLIFKGNLERLDRKLNPPSAQVKSYETGEEIVGQGLESLRKERGRITRPVEQAGEAKDTGIMKLTEDIKEKALEIKEGLKPKNIEDFKFGKQPADRLIADKLGPEAQKMLSKKAPESFTFGDDYYQATNARIIRDAYKNYSPEEADKVVGYYNKLDEQDQLRRSMKQFDTALTPETIMQPATRAILKKFAAEGQVKLSPGTMKAFEQGGADTIDQFRKIFGDDNLEVLDNYITDTGFGLKQSDSYEELAERFVKDYPNQLNKEFLEQTGGVLKPRPLAKDLLTDREKVNFLLNNDGEGNPLDPETFEYLRKNIDPNDPFITKYIMQYALPRGPGTSAREVIKNIPEGYNPPEEVQVVLGMKKPEPEGFAMGGRVGYQAGGAATPEQFAQALSTAGAGTAEQKTRSLMDYVSDYGSQAATAAVPAYQMAKGILGIQGGNLQTEGMTQALQDIIQNQYAQTGQLSGDIGYKDYGVETGPQGNFLGAGDVPLTDPRFALATTLGRASYSIDPNTGKVNFTGGTAYDFPEGSLPLGLAEFINKGGFFGDKAYDYSPDITLPKETFGTQQATNQTQQATSSIPEYYQKNPEYYDFDKFREAYAYASGLQDKVTRSPEGQISVDFGSWDPSRTYQAYMANTGTSSNRPFFEQFAEGNPFQKDLLVSMYGAPGAGKAYYAEGGSVGIPYLLGV